MSDQTVRETAAFATSVFEQLKSASPEFAALVSGRTLRISLFSNFGASAVEVCRVVGDDIEWKQMGASR